MLTTHDMTRQFAIGDIHGCLTALERLDEQLGFGSGDLVVTLGDYVDRGSESRGVIDYLIALRGRCNLVTLRGNHEIMMMMARHDPAIFRDWLICGGDRTMDSYGARSLEEIPAAHWEFLEQTKRYHETARDFFVHANALPHKALSEQPDEVLFWERLVDGPAHVSGRRMICGHTAQRSLLPLQLGAAVCIDTWVYGPGWLTCLETGTGRYWQANQKGDLREGELEEWDGGDLPRRARR
jgi:serine/threonine protein phosphatase 1